MICLNPDHYPQLELPAEYDARLHNYEHPEPCQYACRHCDCDTYRTCCLCGGSR